MLDNDVLKQINARIDELLELRSEYLEDENIELESFTELKGRVALKPQSIKYETGINSIDREMGGFAEGTFIQIAGESFVGKTTLALKILTNISKFTKTLFFSYEMYENVLVHYLKDLNQMQSDNLLIVQDQRELTQIETIISKMSKEGIKFMVVDSRMKINVSGKMEEYQKNSTISKELSRMCQKYGVIIMLINQISEGDLKSGRFSLKGSGDQVYDSDVLFYLTLENKNTDKEQRYIWCEKDRINQKKWKAPLLDNAPIEILYTSEKMEMPIL